MRRSDVYKRNGGIDTKFRQTAANIRMRPLKPPAESYRVGVSKRKSRVNEESAKMYPPRREFRSMSGDDGDFQRNRRKDEYNRSEKKRTGLRLHKLVTRNRERQNLALCDTHSTPTQPLRRLNRSSPTRKGHFSYGADKTHRSFRPRSSSALTRKGRPSKKHLKDSGSPVHLSKKKSRPWREEIRSKYNHPRHPAGNGPLPEEVVVDDPRIGNGYLHPSNTFSDPLMRRSSRLRSGRKSFDALRKTSSFDRVKCNRQHSPSRKPRLEKKYMVKTPKATTPNRTTSAQTEKGWRLLIAGESPNRKRNPMGSQKLDEVGGFGALQRKSLDINRLAHRRLHSGYAMSDTEGVLTGRRLRKNRRSWGNYLGRRLKNIERIEQNPNPTSLTTFLTQTPYDPLMTKKRKKKTSHGKRIRRASYNQIRSRKHIVKANSRNQKGARLLRNGQVGKQPMKGTLKRHGQYRSPRNRSGSLNILEEGSSSMNPNSHGSGFYDTHLNEHGDHHDQRNFEHWMEDDRQNNVRTDVGDKLYNGVSVSVPAEGSLRGILGSTPLHSNNFITDRGTWKNSTPKDTENRNRHISRVSRPVKHEADGFYLSDEDQEDQKKTCVDYNDPRVNTKGRKKSKNKSSRSPKRPKRVKNGKQHVIPKAASKKTRKPQNPIAVPTSRETPNSKGYKKQGTSHRYENKMRDDETPHVKKKSKRQYSPVSKEPHRYHRSQSTRSSEDTKQGEHEECSSSSATKPYIPFHDLSQYDSQKDQPIISPRRAAFFSQSSIYESTSDSSTGWAARAAQNHRLESRKNHSNLRSQEDVLGSDTSSSGTSNSTQNSKENKNYEPSDKKFEKDSESDEDTWKENLVVPKFKSGSLREDDLDPHRNSSMYVISSPIAT